MRSLNTFQNDQTNLLLRNLAQDRRTTSLASQFMDIFDASKLDTSLLRKRELPFQDNTFQKDQLQKKVKTSLTINDFTRPPLQLSNFPPALLNSTLNPINPLFNSLGQDQGYGSLFDQFKAVQNLSFSNILNQQSLPPLPLPSQFNLNNIKPKSLLEKTLAKKDICVKEEYVKQEELPAHQGSPSAGPFKSHLSDGQTTNDLLTENSPAQTDFLIPSESVGEPALADFTRAFPDWDLATIFNYLKSGKSIEVFEKEKQFRLERKLRRQQRRNKEKAAGEKVKKTKGKRAPADEYKPARSAGKRLQEQL